MLTKYAGMTQYLEQMWVYWIVVRIGRDLPTLWMVHWHRRWRHGSVNFIPRTEGNCESWIKFTSFMYIYNLSIVF